LETAKISTDAKAASIRWTHRYPLPDGTETEAYYELKSLVKSRVELSWNTGITP